MITAVIIFSSVLALLTGASALYFFMRYSLPPFSCPMPIEAGLSALLGILCPLIFIISSIQTFLRKDQARVQLVMFTAWNLLLTLFMQAVTYFNIRLPYGEIIHRYILSTWSVYFATYSLVFQARTGDAGFEFNYWAGFLLRVILCLVMLCCLTRIEVKNKFD